MEPVTPRKFLYQWEEHVRISLFPDPVFATMKPDVILVQWAKDPAEPRRRLRYKTDTLIRRVLYAPSAEYVVKLLLSTDPELVAAFYDRLLNAEKRLEVMAHQELTYFEDPYATWRDLARILLLQEPLR